MWSKSGNNQIYFGADADKAVDLGIWSLSLTLQDIVSFFFTISPACMGVIHGHAYGTDIY